jgi:FkbM family methyltransferase
MLCLAIDQRQIMENLKHKLKSHIKAFIQRRGIMVSHYPLQHCLKSLRPTTILDAGANIGQYGRELRSLGYEGKIHSFEPFPPAFDSLKQTAAQSNPPGAWQVHNVGLGEKNGEAQLNVSAESTLNSLREPLPESARLHSGFSSTAPVSVRIRTLDSLWQELDLSRERVFLKMDTQGYELPILMGGAAVLEKISGIQLEASLTPLYKGQPCVEDIIPFLRARGFVIFGVWPGQGIRGKHKEMYEVDFIFVRP